MAAQHRLGFTLPRTVLVVTLLAAVGAQRQAWAQAGGIYISNNYHAQVTSYFCGAAAMEMMLDTPTTTTFGSPTYNQAVVNLLLPGDNGTSPPAPIPYAPPAGAQASIYSLVHGGNYGGLGAFGPYSVYNNPVYGPGTDPIGFAAGLNAIDNPLNANNAATSNALIVNNNGANNGNQQYATFFGSTSLPATVAGGLNASNTVASALLQYQVPASVSINNGGHWIDVNGVSTTKVGPTTYINGFFIRDPWTGYAIAQHQTNMGLGVNTYLRYGYDQFANGSTRIGGWFNYFTPATNTANAGRGVGYSIEVEPQGPESLDTGNDFDLPVILLPTNPSNTTDLNASQALADAGTDIGDTAGLSGESGFEGGNGLDGNDEMLLSMPGDIPGQEGDWLVPYDGSGGVNDVTGAVLIDEDTGVIDQATWFDPSDAMDLHDLDAMFNAESLGIADPSDNAVPEPSSCVIMLMGVAGCGLFLVRRRGVGDCIAA